MATFRVTACYPMYRVYSVKADSEEEAEEKALYLGEYDPGDVQEMVDEEYEGDSFVSMIECDEEDEDEHGSRPNQA